MQPSDRTPDSGPLFTFRTASLILAGSVVLLIVINVFVRRVCLDIFQADCPQAFPVSLFLPRIPDVWQVGLLVGLVIVFLLAVRQMALKLPQVMLLVCFLLIGTSALAGWHYGFEHPLTHRDKRYYTEASCIADPVAFVRTFNDQQATLLEHTQTHPPGAVLMVGLFTWLIPSVGMSAMVMGTLSMMLAVWLVWDFFRWHFPADLAGYGVLLFALLPAVQIYFLSSLESFITVGLLVVLLSFRHWLDREKPTYAALTIISLFWVSFMTFGVLYVFPVLAGYELWRKRSLTRTLIIAGVVAGVWLLVMPVLDFNYLESFLTASSIENPDGFRLLADPVDYIFSRFEGVLEVLLFFGPFLTLLMLRGWHVLHRDYVDYAVWLVLTWGAFLLLLLTGAFRTGETARLMMVLLPFMLTPVLLCVQDKDESMRLSLLMLVFGQTLLMQLLGHYIY